MRRFKETNGQGKVFDTRFSHQTVERMIKDSGVNEGKEERERFTIYGLKHCYISHLIMAGVDIATVSELTGVSIPTLKKHYLRLTQDHLRVAQAKANLTPKAGVELKIV
jgi:site-specific recombinase XerD